jgi:hypothetical protein
VDKIFQKKLELIKSRKSKKEEQEVLKKKSAEKSEKEKKTRSGRYFEWVCCPFRWISYSETRKRKGRDEESCPVV